MIDAGKLKHRLIFQSNAGSTMTDAGEPVLAYTNSFTVWGSVDTPSPMSEIVEGQRVAPVQEAKITIRYRPGINAALRILHKRASTVTAAGVNSSVTTVTLTSALAFELGADDYLLVDSELMRVTAGGTGTTLTVERGALSTTAVLHDSGAVATRMQLYEIEGIAAQGDTNTETVISARRVG